MTPQPEPGPETVGAAVPGPLASFVRFVVCGGGVGVLSSGAVALLAALMPWSAANAVVTVASTALCTELHALFTFGTGRRAGWRRHWQSAGSATAAYAVTSLAMFVLHLVRSSPGAVTEQAVYLGAAGLAGTGRFLVLRLFVFAADRDGTATRDADRVVSARGPVRAPLSGRVPACLPGPVSGLFPVTALDTCGTTGSLPAEERTPARAAAPAPSAAARRPAIGRRAAPRRAAGRWPTGRSAPGRPVAGQSVAVACARSTPRSGAWVRQ